MIRVKNSEKPNLGINHSFSPRWSPEILKKKLIAENNGHITVISTMSEELHIGW